MVIYPCEALRFRTDLIALGIALTHGIRRAGRIPVAPFAIGPFGFAAGVIGTDNGRRRLCLTFTVGGTHLIAV